jgi:hypothetical protein
MAGSNDNEQPRGLLGAIAITAPRNPVLVALASNIPLLCIDAADRMKGFRPLHAQYTLHDDAHLSRVVELMERMIPSDSVILLNAAESALLVLAAYFHDQGMVPDDDEMRVIEGHPDFLSFRERWEIEHPNLGELRSRLSDTIVDGQERERLRRLEGELLDALLSDYLRQTHGQRAASFVRSHYGADARLSIGSGHLAEKLAILCESHTRPWRELTPSHGILYDDRVGAYPVNMVFLASVLRLADILDFDRERTPDSLYRTIHFTSPVSLAEWEKHRSVTGWEISADVIRYNMDCTHPEYQRSAFSFMDAIDEELAGYAILQGDTPFSISRARNLRLALPQRVMRDRIKPKDGAYYYHDLEFTLQRDQIVKLLMTDKLYNSPGLCVRELLQNALDALRYRKTLIKCLQKSDWTDGVVKMEHGVNAEGHEYLRCEDNGIGMDREIIQRYFAKVGRSFYRSPEFEQERLAFRAANVDFDPCSQFGIGFMSCFMVGDRITIRTRRDYGPQRGWGEPLVVEINGLNNMLVVRRGLENQPVGTTVEIVGRKKPGFFDGWVDRIHLLEMLDGYALACEFPIQARCSIPEIAGEFTVDPVAAEPPTELEALALSSCLTLAQRHGDVALKLGGTVRASFLLDEDGKVTLANRDAAWEQGDHGPVISRSIGGKIEPHGFHAGKTCLDGILVCGQPGRLKKPEHLGECANHISMGIDRFVLDVRGDLKPPLTPARVPASDPFLPHPHWAALQKLASCSHGRLWEKVLDHLPKTDGMSVFWQLAEIHGAHVPYMRAGVVWSRVSLPFATLAGNSEWRRFENIGPLRIEGSKGAVTLTAQDGSTLCAPPEVRRWKDNNKSNHSDWHMVSTVACLSVAMLRDGAIHLVPREPDDANAHPGTRILSERHTGVVFMIPFAGEIADCISVQSPLPTANSQTALVQRAMKARFKVEPQGVDSLAIKLVWCFGDGTGFKAMAQPDAPVGRWIRHIGHLASSIDWSTQNASLRPPYRLWMPDAGFAVLDDSVFARWVTGA